MITQSTIDSKNSSARAVGIITGSGPEAGIDLWQKMLALQRRRLGDAFRGDLDAPHIVIFSVPELGRSMDLRRNEAVVWETLRQACIDIAPHCGSFAIACNTLHYYAPRIAALGLESSFVSIVDAARLAVGEAARVGLLGADPVIDLDGGLSPYEPLRHEIDVEVPSESLQSLILDVKRIGGDHPEVVERFERLLASLAADKIFLACTELPLIKTSGAGKTLVDLTEILAAMLLERQTGAPRADVR